MFAYYSFYYHLIGSFIDMFRPTLRLTKFFTPESVRANLSLISQSKLQIPSLVRNPKLHIHYKGGEYAVIGHGIHTETEEELVFYYSPKDFKFYARPKDMFYSKVKWNNQIVDRFEPIGKVEI